jgi:hypothetical protein
MLRCRSFSPILTYSSILRFVFSHTPCLTQTILRDIHRISMCITKNQTRWNLDSDLERFAFFCFYLSSAMQKSELLLFENCTKNPYRQRTWRCNVWIVHLQNICTMLFSMCCPMPFSAANFYILAQLWSRVNIFFKFFQTFFACPLSQTALLFYQSSAYMSTTFLFIFS